MRGAAALWHAFSTSIRIFFWCVIRSDRFSWAFWGIFVACSSFLNPRMPPWIQRERFLFPPLLWYVQTVSWSWELEISSLQERHLSCVVVAGSSLLPLSSLALVYRLNGLQPSKYGEPPLSFSALSGIHHLLPRKSQANHLTIPCFCFFTHNMMIIKTQFVDAVVWLKWVNRSKLLETVPDLECLLLI